MNDTTLRKPLRLWPGVVLVVLQWLGWLVIPEVVSAPEAAMFGILGGLLLGPLILVWWTFFSRAHWSERVGAAVLVVVSMGVTPRLLHDSVAMGNLGFQYFLYAIPVVSLAFVAWAVASRRLPDAIRRATMVAIILIACGSFTLVRSEGLSGDGLPEFTWRWTETSEERLLASKGDEPEAAATASNALADVAWPGFRGPDRDGVVRGLRIESDWSAVPPTELWRRPIGPGVSSFAVGGELFYTQEQRGDDEIVSCYKISTGEPVWMHRDAARHWDSHVGAGPRATPALGGGRVYALGATGILNALDAVDGTVVWSRNAAVDTEARVPSFGFVNSPLVIDDVVIVNTNKLVAYDLASGDLRWIGPSKGGSYSSPHPLTLNGVRQVVMPSGESLTSVSPVDGSLLWEHQLEEGNGCIVQPAWAAEGEILISTMVNATAGPVGTHRIAVAKGAGGWTTQERWASRGLKPSFSQIVVHKGHAYGFDGRILACIDLEDGKRKWKGGRYGHGQILLLADQDLLLVVSERGDLALVEALADRFTELARLPAIEGKTWNQPALVRDRLLVRNGQEMAAFRLSPPTTDGLVKGHQ